MGLCLNTNKMHRFVYSFPLLLLKELFYRCGYSLGPQCYWVILKMLPDTAGRGADKGKLFAGPDMCKQGRSGEGREGWGQLCLQ